MKATLEFNLPEESSDHLNAVNGAKWKNIAWEIDQKLRAKVKYENCSETLAEYIHQLRDEIADLMASDGLTFEE